MHSSSVCCLSHFKNDYWNAGWILEMFGDIRVNYTLMDRWMDGSPERKLQTLQKHADMNTLIMMTITGPAPLLISPANTVQFDTLHIRVYSAIQQQSHFIEIALNCIVYHNKLSVFYMGSKAPKGWLSSTLIWTIDTVSHGNMNTGKILLVSWRGSPPEREMKAFRVVSVTISFKLEA